MKLYKNVSRFAMRRLRTKSKERWLLWGLSLKVGDVISVCSGFNVRLTKVTPSVMNFDPYYYSETNKTRPRCNRRGWFIDSVTVEDEEGGFHFTDSCCSPARTVAEIEGYYRAMSEAVLEECGPHTRLMWNAIRAGIHVTDELGILLPEFRRNKLIHT